jgi:N-acetyl-anhydromuramyl-L-alanine amidase AmpD
VSYILYPKATWKPLTGHSMAGTLEQKNLVVLHIAEGSSAMGVFSTFSASKPPDRTSAHFCIDRDGTVYQFLDLRDTAFHASAVNQRSIGIEHAAMSKFAADKYNLRYKTKKFVELPATEAQYAASAELVWWLCKLLKIPLNRKYVQEHCEASPSDGHLLCCHAELDPNRVVAQAICGY